MSNLVPQSAAPAGAPTALENRSVRRELTRLERAAIVRTAAVQAESFITAQKLREVDFLAKEAMSGQALLRNWADNLCGGDPLGADEMRFYLDMAKMAKGEIMAEVMTRFARESGR